MPVSHEMTHKESVIYGVSPVAEALQAHPHQVNKILVAAGVRSNRLTHIIERARCAGIPVHIRERDHLARLLGHAHHQGVIAFLAPRCYARAEDILRALGPDSLVVVLDEVEDPRNLGAIIRTAHCAGVDAVVLPARRAAGVTETVAKTSAGAVEYTPVARVTNLVRFLRQLKDQGVRVLGVEAEGKTPYTESVYEGPVALVFGSEGYGLRRLVKETCDLLLSIPLRGRISSLNVSVAVGIVLFEALRQRSLRGHAQ